MKALELVSKIDNGEVSGEDIFYWLKYVEDYDTLVKKELQRKRYIFLPDIFEAVSMQNPEMAYNMLVEHKLLPFINFSIDYYEEEMIKNAKFNLRLKAKQVVSEYIEKEFKHKIKKFMEKHKVGIDLNLHTYNSSIYHSMLLENNVVELHQRFTQETLQDFIDIMKQIKDLKYIIKVNSSSIIRNPELLLPVKILGRRMGEDRIAFVSYFMTFSQKGINLNIYLKKQKNGTYYTRTSSGLRQEEEFFYKLLKDDNIDWEAIKSNKPIMLESLGKFLEIVEKEVI